MLRVCEVGCTPLRSSHELESSLAPNYEGNFGSTVMKWMAPFAGTEAEAWETLTVALGLNGVLNVIHVGIRNEEWELCVSNIDSRILQPYGYNTKNAIAVISMSNDSY